MPSSNSLFEPVTLRGLTLANRIVVSPMCQYSCRDGFATDWHLVHLGSRAIGGAGLLIVEATAVSPEGRITPADLGLWKDEHVEKLSQITGFAHSQGAAIGIQLAHAGRKASMNVPWEGERLIPPAEGGWSDVVAPSSIPFSDAYAVPNELSPAGIDKVKTDFLAATRRALRAGFDSIEIHSAHGYLLHSFLSPLSNVRQDQYGGPFENRTRLLREVTAAVRHEIPESMPLFVRISATDWVEGGWTLAESVELAKLLKKDGADCIDASSGGLVPYAKIPAGPGYQTPFALAIRQEAQIATAAVGFIVDPAQAEHIIRCGQADLVVIAREMLRDPYWPLHAAQRLDRQITWPCQYLRAAPPQTAGRQAFSNADSTIMNSRG